MAYTIENLRKDYVCYFNSPAVIYGHRPVVYTHSSNRKHVECLDKYICHVGG